MNLSNKQMTLFGSRNIQLSVKAHINKKVDVIIFALLRAPTDKEGKRKKTPRTSENTELSLAGLHRATTTTIFRAFSLLRFIYSCPSLTESSVLKVNNFWVSISPFSLKDWLRRADQNRGQVDNQSRISRKALSPFKVFRRGAAGVRDSINWNLSATSLEFLGIPRGFLISYLWTSDFQHAGVYLIPQFWLWIQPKKEARVYLPPINQQINYLQMCSFIWLFHLFTYDCSKYHHQTVSRWKTITSRWNRMLPKRTWKIIWISDS